MGMPSKFQHIKSKLEPLLGQPVMFVKKEGSKRTRYKGTLSKLYNAQGLIELDPDEHPYKTYSFSYVHVLMDEGELVPWDKSVIEAGSYEQ